jgi:hypothetical protein
MTNFAVTPLGLVSGTNDELVAAAADVVFALPTQRMRPDRLAELLTAVRAPWADAA